MAGLCLDRGKAKKKKEEGTYRFQTKRKSKEIVRKIRLSVPWGNPDFKNCGPNIRECPSGLPS